MAQFRVLHPRAWLQETKLTLKITLVYSTVGLLALSIFPPVLQPRFWVRPWTANVSDVITNTLEAQVGAIMRTTSIFIDIPLHQWPKQCLITIGSRLHDNKRNMASLNLLSTHAASQYNYAFATIFVATSSMLCSFILIDFFYKSFSSSRRVTEVSILRS